MRVLVTGGAGFIGSHLVEALVERGASVRVFDNLSSGHLENLEGLLGRVEVALGDVRDPAALALAVRGCDAVLHHAAVASVALSVEDPLAVHEVNATGTLRLLEACRGAGVRRVVYAASSSVYGDGPDRPKREASAAEPLSPYAVAKHCGEMYCRVFTQVYGLETICLRYFNVFGPRQDPSSPYASVISRFVEAFSEGRRPVLFGDGRQTRDFVYVTNVVDANLLALEAGRSAVGEAFNVACGRSHSLLELLALLRELLDVQIEPRFEEARPGDVKRSEACLARASSVLGFHPRVDLRAGLGRLLDWLGQRQGARSAPCS